MFRDTDSIEDENSHNIEREKKVTPAEFAPKASSDHDLSTRLNYARGQFKKIADMVYKINYSSNFDEDKMEEISGNSSEIKVDKVKRRADLEVQINGIEAGSRQIKDELERQLKEVTMSPVGKDLDSVFELLDTIYDQLNTMVDSTYRLSRLCEEYETITLWLAQQKVNDIWGLEHAGVPLKIPVLITQKELQSAKLIKLRGEQAENLHSRKEWLGLRQFIQPYLRDEKGKVLSSIIFWEKEIARIGDAIPMLKELDSSSINHAPFFEPGENSFGMLKLEDKFQSISNMAGYVTEIKKEVCRSAIEEIVNEYEPLLAEIERAKQDQMKLPMSNQDTVNELLNQFNNNIIKQYTQALKSLRPQPWLESDTIISGRLAGLEEKNDYSSSSVIDRLDLRNWDMMKNNPSYIEAIRERNLEYIDAMVGDGVIDGLTDPDININNKYEKKIKDTQDIKYLPVIIVNLLSHQVTHPSIDNIGVELLECLDSFPTNQLNEFLQQEGSDLAELVGLIRGNASDLKDSGYISDSEVYDKIRSSLITLSHDRITKNDEFSIFYVKRIIHGLHRDSNGANLALADLLKTNQPQEIKETIVDFFLNKEKSISDIKVLLGVYGDLDQKLKDNIGENNVDLANLTQEQVSSLVNKLSKIEDYPNKTLVDDPRFTKYIFDNFNNLDKILILFDQNFFNNMDWNSIYLDNLHAIVSIPNENLEICIEKLALVNDFTNKGLVNSSKFGEYIFSNLDEVDKILEINKQGLLDNASWTLAYIHNLDAMVAMSHEDIGIYSDKLTELSSATNRGLVNASKFSEYIFDNLDKLDRLIVLFEQGALSNESWNQIYLNNLDTIISIPNEELKSSLEKLTIIGNYANESLVNDSTFGEYIFNNLDKLDKIIGLMDKNLLDDEGLNPIYLGNLDLITSIPNEKAKDYFGILAKIGNSPSQEIQRIKNQLLDEILATDNPLEKYSQIENIFIKNNSPTFLKVYEIFKILHPAEVLEGKLKNSKLSPYLIQADNDKRYEIIYRDLLKIHMVSGNRTLRDYFQTIRDSLEVFQVVDSSGMDSLNETMIEQLQDGLKRIETLSLSNQLGRNPDPSKDGPGFEHDSLFNILNPSFKLNILAKYKEMAREVGVEEGQSLSQRLVDIYLRPSGLETFDDALRSMKQFQNDADRRGRELVAGWAGQPVRLETGDFLKGVKSEYITSILQNGSVAKEYLGSSSDSDLTPFDTDLARIDMGESLDGDLNSAIEGSMANTYAGGLFFVIKNDSDEFSLTTKDSSDGYDESKFELFKTLGEEHYGIRTGFPTSSIDFMVAQDSMFTGGASAKIENVYFEIAQNGFYIPVVNLKGEVIFTPELYDQYRKAFDGIKQFGSFDDVKFNFISSRRNKMYPRIEELVANLPVEKQEINNISEKLREDIGNNLKEIGIEMKSGSDRSLLESGAEFIGTGSTSRFTGTPGNYDFDFILKLDAQDYTNSQTIIDRIGELLKPQRLENNNGTLRAFGIPGFDDELINVDITFSRKSELTLYGSHDAIEGKLAWIEENLGEESYNETVANIVLAKEVLGAGEAYKAFDHGGMGGIGVENWILSNGGNMEAAFRSFYEVASRVGSTPDGFEKFRKEYRILDPGINVKNASHDNYVYKLKYEGYQKMIEVIGAYLKEEDSK